MPPSGRGRHDEGASAADRPVLQVGQPAAHGHLGRDPDPVVLDLDQQVEPDDDPDHHLVRVGVPRDVGQRLPHHCDRVLGDVLRHGGRDAVGTQPGHEPEAVPRVHHLGVDAVPQPGPRRPATGAEPEDRRAHVLDGLVQVVDRALEPARHVGVHHLLRGSLHVEPDGEQTLDDHVVQVARDPLALLEHREACPVGLCVRHVEREGELLGEARDARQVRLGRRSGVARRPGQRERADPALGAAQRDRQHPGGAVLADVRAVRDPCSTGHRPARSGSISGGRSSVRPYSREVCAPSSA